MSISTLQVGQVVRLKSGGPDMTFVNVYLGFYACRWFDGTRLATELFHPDSLELAPAQTKEKANDDEHA